MNFATLGLAASIALASAGLAQAQDAARLDDLDADRLNATQVIIEFEYDGGACDAVGPAELGDLVDGVQSVTFSIVQTADMCTQQIVEVEVEQAVTIGPEATHVDVTLLATDGSIFATGRDRIDND